MNMGSNYMKYLRSKNGISIVALIITTIVLLVLAGMTAVMAKDLVIDKAVMASEKATEANLKEIIDLIWLDTEISYWSEAKGANKMEYFKMNMETELQKIEDVTNIRIIKNGDSGLKVCFSYKNEMYQFTISSEGDVSIVDSESKLLKGNVKIGDYVEYPIEYKDVYSEKTYTTTNGWRVIGDGIMKGTSDQVKIISTGIPAKWYYDDEQTKVVVENLTNHFEELILQPGNDGTEIKGHAFKNEKLADRITTVSLTDLNQVYNNIYDQNRALNDVTMLEDKYELFDLKSSGVFFYWLATRNTESNGIYYISDEGIDIYDVKIKIGIRPVIYLKNELTGKFENNVWKVDS